jgi:hypothetical protein
VGTHAGALDVGDGVSVGVGVGVSVDEDEELDTDEDLELLMSLEIVEETKSQAYSVSTGRLGVVDVIEGIEGHPPSAPGPETGMIEISSTPTRLEASSDPVELITTVTTCTSPETCTWPPTRR